MFYFFCYSLVSRICTNFLKSHDTEFAMILCGLQCKHWFLGEKMYMANVPAGNYMFKSNNRNTKTRCEICSKLTIKTPERCQICTKVTGGVFIVNFENTSHLVLMFLLWILSRQMPAGFLFFIFFLRGWSITGVLLR